MAKAKRVFEVAKELGVTSKAIVDKCRAENVPGIDTHMSPVKIGLVETIRQWFSEGHQVVTAVEQAEHVDLEKVKQARRKRAKAVGGHEGAEEGSASAATLEHPEQSESAGGSIEDEGSAPAVEPVIAAEEVQASSAALPDQAPADQEAPVVAAAEEPAAPAPSAPVVAAESAEPADAPEAPQNKPSAPVQAPAAVAARQVPPTAVPQGPAGPRPVTQGPGQIAARQGTPAAAPGAVPPAGVRPPAQGGAVRGPFQPGPVRGPFQPGAVRGPFQPLSPAGQGPAGPIAGGGQGPAGAGPQGAQQGGGPVHVPGPVRPRTISPVGVPNVPSRPMNVQRAGEVLHKPQEVALKGPKVVRIEQPDQIRAPRPRRPMPGGGPGGPGGFQQPGAAGGAGAGDITRSRGPVRGRGAGAPPEPAVTETETDASGVRKRRSTNVRRGRSAEALPTGPTRFTEADLAELDARLNRATGFLKQRRRDLKKHEGLPGQAPSPSSASGAVQVAEPVTIKSLSAAIGVKSTDIIKYLLRKGIMATVNSAIDNNMAMEVAAEHNIELQVTERQTAQQQIVTQFAERQELDVRPRPPIVAVLGHVDHGKTSLLDAIRKSDVASGEDGGITQHIGAYRVTIKGQDGNDKSVVFLDTPGHEAFTSMRARGARMTDLVVLVVAADDGVMPQTIESINHAKAANVPIIVALNKIDKPEATEANVRKIFGQLAEQGLHPTEWGGSTEVVRVSAVKNQGITDLLEMLDYQAALLELKADYEGPARGSVIEAQMQPGRGPVARVLVQQGKLAVGDFIVTGRAFGRVRDMTDDRGQGIREAGPATPVELSGIDMIPDAGDKFYIADTLQQAEEIAKQFREAERQKQLAAKSKVTLDNFAQRMAEGEVKELRVVVKADVQGSIDVLAKSLSDLRTSEVAVKVIHAAVGGINESDVLLADASDAVIIGFHVVASPHARELAEQHEVDLRLYRIIYDVIDDVKKGLEGMLSPEKREEVLGTAEVREVFKITKLGSVAGCLVLEGSIKRSFKVRVTRQDVVVTDERSIESLRRVKEDVGEVRAGTECGIRLVGFDDIKSGDKIVCYKTIEVQRTLG